MEIEPNTPQSLTYETQRHARNHLEPGELIVFLVRVNVLDRYGFDWTRIGFLEIVQRIPAGAGNLDKTAGGRVRVGRTHGDRQAVAIREDEPGSGWAFDGER